MAGDGAPRGSRSWFSAFSATQVSFLSVNARYASPNASDHPALSASPRGVDPRRLARRGGYRGARRRLIASSERGQWVYTDRPSDRGNAESVALGTLGAPLANGCRVAVDRGRRCAGRGQPLQVHGRIRRGRRTPDRPADRRVVAAESEIPLLDVPAEDGPSSFATNSATSSASPTSRIGRRCPTRAVALAQRFRVSCGAPTPWPPGRREPGAIDIAMPVAAMHAARERLVIDVARNHFRSGLQLAAMSQANFVRSCTTTAPAIYARLRMEPYGAPGQRVRRSEYIANSRNTDSAAGRTCISSFWRSRPRSESLPSAFAGSGGADVAPHTGQMCTVVLNRRRPALFSRPSRTAPAAVVPPARGRGSASNLGAAAQS